MNEKEKASRKAAFHEMSAPERLDYILTYYKVPIIAILLILFILCSQVYRHLTKKETLLYAGFVNVSVGETLSAALQDDYFESAGISSRKNQLQFYEALYLSDDADTLNHQYAYASRMKVTAAIADHTLDLVFMNQEGYDLLSRSGYLLDLRRFLQENAPSLADQADPLYAENEVVVEDNSLEYTLNETDELIVTTRTDANALEISALPLFAEAGFDGDVFVGVITNTPRSENVISYLHWILTEGSGS